MACAICFFLLSYFCLFSSIYVHFLNVKNAQTRRYALRFCVCVCFVVAISTKFHDRFNEEINKFRVVESNLLKRFFFQKINVAVEFCVVLQRVQKRNIYGVLLHFSAYYRRFNQLFEENGVYFFFDMCLKC